MDLSTIKILVAGIFAEDCFRIVRVYDNIYRRSPNFTVELMNDDQAYEILLSAEYFGKWNVLFFYSDGHSRIGFGSERNISSPRKALGLAKHAVMSHRQREQVSVEATPATQNTSAPTLTLEQFKATIRRVFDDVRGPRNEGTGENPEFKVEVFMADLVTIELSLWHGKWMAREPVSNTAAYAKSTSTTPYDLLDELKTKLMA